MKKTKLQAKSATPKPATPPSRSNLLQRTCQCGAVPGVTGECEKCASQRLSNSLGTINQAGGLNDRSASQNYHFGDLAIAPKQRFGIQAKLTIGQPNDKYEQEADRVADQVMRMPDPEAALQRQSKKPEEDEEKQKRLQRKPLLPQGEPAGAEEDEDKKKRLQRKPMAETGHKVSVEMQDRIQHLQQQGGQPLSGSERAFFEPRFGQNFSQVRLHADAETADVARSVNARAFTVGRDVVFGPGQYQPRSPEGQRLLAHELTHVVQQVGEDRRVQLYEAGEHGQLGETQAELQTAFAPTSYIVQKGDKLSTIAQKFMISVEELKEANKDKLKKWPASNSSGRMIEGFNDGETVSIPQKLNDLAKALTKDKSAIFTVNGVVLDYGVAIAMGDLFDSPEQMAQASPDELRDLAILIKREQSGGKPVTTEEWQKATRGRYLNLAQKNVAHFAPPNVNVAPLSAAESLLLNHQKEWEKYHHAALDASKSGDKNKALMINAYGDHFLTDTFSTGHLINKIDVMEQFKSQLKLDVKGEEFTAESKKFFDEVAKETFTGGVKSEFSQHETVEVKGGVFRPNIDSESRFSALLQAIHKEEPDLLANAVAKGVHDRLNVIPGGLPVENAKGDQWQLSGDGNLNAQTMGVARKAVAQSQINISSTFKLAGQIDYAALDKKVWDYTPRPSTAGIKQLTEIVKQGTDIKSLELKKSVIKLIQDNYMLIIAELVKRKKLKKV